MSLPPSPPPSSPTQVVRGVDMFLECWVDFGP
jgi:hypothetical protein